MSCINCEDCEKNLAPFPECFTGLLHLTSSGDIALIVFEKAGGARITVPFQGNSGAVDVDFSATGFDTTFFREASGLITVRAFDSTGEAISLSDTATPAVVAECALLEFKAEYPDAAEISLLFA